MTRYKGGYLDQSGYQFVLDNGKYRREHRVVAEQKLGRPLEKGEVVHHIDGDKLNNHPDNLEVLTNSQHTKHHWETNPDGFQQPKKKVQPCIECLEVQTIYAKGWCYKCYQKFYQRNYKK